MFGTILSVLITGFVLLMIPVILFVVFCKVFFALLSVPFKVVGGLFSGLFSLVGAIFTILGKLLFGLIGLFVGIFLLILLPFTPILLGILFIWMVMRWTRKSRRVAQVA